MANDSMEEFMLDTQNKLEQRGNLINCIGKRGKRKLEEPVEEEEVFDKTLEEEENHHLTFGVPKAKPPPVPKHQNLVNEVKIDTSSQHLPAPATPQPKKLDKLLKFFESGGNTPISKPPLSVSTFSAFPNFDVSLNNSNRTLDSKVETVSLKSVKDSKIEVDFPPNNDAIARCDTSSMSNNKENSKVDVSLNNEVFSKDETDASVNNEVFSKDETDALSNNDEDNSDKVGKVETNVSLNNEVFNKTDALPNNEEDNTEEGSNVETHVLLNKEVFSRFNKVVRKVETAASVNNDVIVRCDTPSRSMLMDEINADYERYTNSLPRPSRSRPKDECDGTPMRSLHDYRRTLVEQKTTKTSEVHREHKNPVSEEEKLQFAKDYIKSLDKSIKVHTAQHEQGRRALRLIHNEQREEDEQVAAHLVMLQCRVTVEAAMRMREIVDFNPAEAMVPDMKASFEFNQVQFELHPEFQRKILIDPISVYFAIVITHRDTVKCSNVISARKHFKGKVNADMYTLIDGVGPGFEIYVDIYMLKLAKKDEEKKSMVAEWMGTLLRSSHSRQDLSSMDCAFTKIGSTKLTSSNLKNRNLKAETVQPLASRIHVSFEHKLMETSHSFEGLVRRYEIVGGVANWANEYAVFSNWHLNFFASQREFTEKKPFLKSVNLRKAFEVMENESSASYNYSFIINYINMETNEQEELKLAACCHEDQMEWLRILKTYVNGINFWAAT